jgi:tetratricopeptide (TPR) repeat protein
MKRPRQHVLEDESRNALRIFLPSEWIIRDIKPDYGIDMEVEIVEDDEVTGKVIWVQLKATENKKPNQKTIPFSITTKHLKYYESCQLPVLIIYYIKSINTFYYLFAQEYIRETLSLKNLDWRNQKYANIKFPLDSKLADIKVLKSIATEGYLYVAQQQLNLKPETKSALYWLDGIPQSDDEDLKKRTLKALMNSLANDYPSAIKEYEDILRLLTLSPTQRMSLLLNLGNAYYSISQNDNALKNYKAMLKLSEKVSDKDALEGKSNALAGIGLIYSDKGDMEKALKYQKGALKIHKEIGYKQGEAADLGNIGLIYYNKCDLDQALKYHNDALKIYKKIGYKQGEANQLGNIGLIYYNKGDLDQALKYHNDALKIHKEIGYKQGEASQLGNIGNIYLVKGNLDKALKNYQDVLQIERVIGHKQGEAKALCNIGLIYRAKGELDSASKYLKEALKIDKEIGYKQGEASEMSNIGLIYRAKGDLDNALKYYNHALKIDKEIGYKQGEASDLGNIGLIYSDKGDLNNALKYHKHALKIDKEIGYKQGEASALGNIGLIYSDKGDLNNALKCLKEAINILDTCKLVYGRDIIQKAIDSFTKKVSGGNS